MFFSSSVTTGKAVAVKHAIPLVHISENCRVKMNIFKNIFWKFLT